MNAPRNVPLIERRADARELGEAIRAHRKSCQPCSSERVRGTCDREKEMQAELKPIREELEHWFEPPADAETLF